AFSSIKKAAGKGGFERRVRLVFARYLLVTFLAVLIDASMPFDASVMCSWVDVERMWVSKCAITELRKPMMSALRLSERFIMRMPMGGALAIWLARLRVNSSS